MHTLVVMYRAGGISTAVPLEFVKLVPVVLVYRAGGISTSVVWPLESVNLAPSVEVLGGWY